MKISKSTQVLPVQDGLESRGQAVNSRQCPGHPDRRHLIKKTNLLQMNLLYYEMILQEELRFKNIKE